MHNTVLDVHLHFLMKFCMFWYAEKMEQKTGHPKQNQSKFKYSYIHMYSPQMPIHGPGDATLQCAIEWMFRHRKSQTT